MRVQITSCDYPESWFAGKVGEIFEVEPDDDYFVLADRGLYRRFITKNHCRVLPDDEDAADPPSQK